MNTPLLIPILGGTAFDPSQGAVPGADPAASGFALLLQGMLGVIAPLPIAPAGHNGALSALAEGALGAGRSGAMLEAGMAGQPLLAGKADMLPGVALDPGLPFQAGGQRALDQGALAAFGAEGSLASLKAHAAPIALATALAPVEPGLTDASLMASRPLAAENPSPAQPADPLAHPLQTSTPSEVRSLAMPSVQPGLMSEAPHGAMAKTTALAVSGTAPGAGAPAVAPSREGLGSNVNGFDPGAAAPAPAETSALASRTADATMTSLQGANDAIAGDGPASKLAADLEPANDARDNDSDPVGTDRKVATVEVAAADTTPGPRAEGAGSFLGDRPMVVQAGRSDAEIGFMSSDRNLDAERPIPVPHQPPAQQLALRIGQAASQSADRLFVQLHPVELGGVEIRLEFGPDGQVSANFTAERPQTLDILQRDARNLERGLAEAGIRLESGGLSFSLRQDHPGGDGTAAGWQAAQSAPWRSHAAPAQVIEAAPPRLYQGSLRLLDISA